MLNDTKGVYFSLKLDHKANYPDTQFSEIRLILRLKNNPFNWLQVEDNVGRQMMGPKETCKVKTREVIRKCDWSIDAL